MPIIVFLSTIIIFYYDYYGVGIDVYSILTTLRWFIYLYQLYFSESHII
jgi:hypothetical protein